MSNNQAVTTIDLSSSGLKKIASGKVREIFEIDAQTLLFIATDRISAYDVILTNGIPGKGVLLTQLSVHWFNLIKARIPKLNNHLITTEPPPAIPADVQQLVDKRSMLVHRFEIIPLESIVRGYITGSAWSEYKTKGTVHGMPMTAGLKESQRLENAIWTPSTKAPAGKHDENISKARAVEMVGSELAEKIEAASLQVYEMVRSNKPICRHKLLTRIDEYGPATTQPSAASLSPTPSSNSV